MSNVPKPNPDNTQLAHYLVGAAAVGGGGALLTSLLNHFKTLNQRRERAEDTSGDDDVLYVNLRRPAVKQAGNAVNMAAAAVTIPAAYALVRKVYQERKRKALQQELDEAQNAYLDVMLPQGEKTANTLDKALSLPLAVALVAMASSGVLTDRILDKNFPAPKTPNSVRPRRLVLRDQPPEAQLPAPEAAEKMASEADAAEGLLELVLINKEAAVQSGLEDLVKAAAQGRTEELLHASDAGAEALFEVVKSAGVDAPVSELRRDLAVGWLVREPELAPVVKLAAALEFAEAYPLALALGRAAPAELKDELVKFAAMFRQAVRARRYQNTELPVVKSAYGIADALRDAIEGAADNPEDQMNSGESQDSKEAPIKVEAQGPVSKKILSKKRDAIDEMLTPAKGEAVTV